MKYTLLMAMIFLILSFILSITTGTPEAQDDIPLFQEYIAENINKKSDDPYISSTVNPGEPLYEFLMLIQQGRGALEPLEPLIEKGNTDAMVWMGRVNSNDINVRGETIALLGRAMNAGNPYAALALSNAGEECWEFGQNSLGTQVLTALGEKLPKDIETCSKDNLEIALKGFQELAEQGDLPSQYFLLERNRRKQPDDSREAHEFYINEIIRFSEQYYYKPLMDYVKTILKKRGNTYQLTGETPELEDLAVNLLTIASNHNYSPAINMLIEYSYTKLDKDSPLFYQGIQLGSKRTLRWMQIFEYENSVYTPEERYYLARLYQEFTEEDRLYWEEDIDEGKRASIDEKIEKTLNEVTPMIYLDGFSLRRNWVD